MLSHTDAVLVPRTVFQLAAVLLLIVPGIIYSGVRRRLGGPTPEDQALSVRLTRAIGISVILDLTYIFVAGAWLVRLVRGDGPDGSLAGLVEQPRLSAVVGLGLLVVIPASLALLGQLRFRIPGRERPRQDADIPQGSHRWVNSITSFLRRWSPLRVEPVYHPAPSAWDRVAPDRGDTFVRIFTDDGNWVGGYLGDRSYVSTYPQPRDLFILVEWEMSETGEFIKAIPDSLGVYLPLSGKERVAWLAVPDQSDEEHLNRTRRWKWAQRLLVRCKDRADETPS